MSFSGTQNFRLEGNNPRVQKPSSSGQREELGFGSNQKNRAELEEQNFLLFDQ